MSEMISIEFSYRNKIYQALVRCTRIDGVMQVRVTVMDGEIEKVISGHHIFLVNNGNVTPAKDCPDSHIKEIQTGIISHLQQSRDFSQLYQQYGSRPHTSDHTEEIHHSNLIGEPLHR